MQPHEVLSLRQEDCLPGGGTSIGGVTTCPCGTLVVRVWKLAICWDTPPGLQIEADAVDPPFSGAAVNIDGHCAHNRTGDSGTITIPNCETGSHRVTASADGYVDITAALRERPERLHAASAGQLFLDDEIDVQRRTTTTVDRVLVLRPASWDGDRPEWRGRECNRRHLRPSPAHAEGHSSLGCMFWSDEPARLVARDNFWIMCVALSVLHALGAFAAMPALMLGCSALFAALAAYTSGIIWGKGIGTVLILSAFAYFGVSFLVSIMVFHPDVFEVSGLSLAAGIWVAFGLGYFVVGLPRLVSWKSCGFGGSPAIGPALAGVVTTIGLLVAFPGDWSSLAAVLICLVCAAISFFVSWWTGLCGHAFAEEGETRRSGPTGWRLPFDGERYCVQGPHGYWTHFEEKEGCYDFAVPDGAPIYSCEEGHIVAIEDRVSYEYRRPLEPDHFEHPTTDAGAIAFRYETEAANYIKVRHRDGSSAKYALLRTHGVAGQVLHHNDSERQTFIESAREEACPSDPFDDTPTPAFVLQGQQLGICGWDDHDRTHPRHTPTRRPLGHWVGWAALWTVGWLAALSIPLLTVWSGPPPREGGGAWHNPWGLDGSGCWTDDPTCQQFLLDNPEYARKLFGSSIPGLMDPPQAFDKDYCGLLTQKQIEEFWPTVSTLSWLVTGGIILWLFVAAGCDGKPYRNRMTMTEVFPAIYIAIVIFMGPASAFFHGSFVAFPALGDSWSIVIWESFIVSYNLTRMLNWSKSTALSMFAIICVVAMLFQVAWGKTEMLMGGLVIVSVIMVGCSPNVRTSVAGNGWLWASIATFGAAVFVWKKSFSTGPWCNPHTGLGHSVWHILAAFLTLTIYYYFREEQNPEPSDPHLHFEARMRDGLSGENPCVPVRFAETSSADGGHPWGMRKYSGSSETYPIAQIPGPFEFRPR